MGRKIPGKKHRGVNDPAKQRLERQAKLKIFINAPPTNPNVQELPKSVLEMNRLRELVRSGKFKNNKKKKKIETTNQLDSSNFINTGPKLPGMNQEDVMFPSLRQKPGESEESFLWRLDVATHDALNEAKLGVKHDMVVNRNDSVNITDITPKPSKPPKQNTGPMQKKPAQNTSSSAINKDKLSYLKEKKLKKKLKKISTKEDGLEKKKDYVKFGEVVHQPPQIKKRPRGCDSATFGRPGKKNLLLTDLLKPSSGKESQSMSDKRQLASARDEAIKVYKGMKAKQRLAR